MALFITIFLIATSIVLLIGIFMYCFMIRESLKNLGQPRKKWHYTYKPEESTFEGEEGK